MLERSRQHIRRITLSALGMVLCLRDHCEEPMCSNRPATNAIHHSLTVLDNI